VRRPYLRPISLVARQELAGNKGHHAGDAVAGFQHLSGIALQLQVPHDLRHDLPASARRHRFLHEVAWLIDGQSVAPKDLNVCRLTDEMGLVRQYDRRKPPRFWKGN